MQIGVVYRAQTTPLPAHHQPMYCLCQEHLRSLSPRPHNAPKSTTLPLPPPPSTNTTLRTKQTRKQLSEKAKDEVEEWGNLF
ncbi:hypothetical protein RRG08_065006 [Elysia crispata]|uniref:Uncharacterized protein n=1 Tax=Elysia crispata TaxID=231223 RepID=A0AAE1DZB0_9GAST|nr:hypothetical protein RRG08_065006 [Elysia crispata]